MVASTTASACELVPLTVKKSPPITTCEPSGVTSTARPTSSVFAVNGLSWAPVVTAANLFRVCPATLLKSPPRYTVSSVTASARTVAETATLKSLRGVHVAVSTAAMLLTPTPLTAPN